VAQNLKTSALNNEQLDAREDRLINEILSPGLLESGDEFLVQQQGSPNMTVRVGSGSIGDRFVVAGPGGTYLVRNQDAYIGSGNSDVSIANGDATFDRIDGIDLVVYDDPFDSSGDSVAEVVVTQGTPASSPSAPALPSGVAVERLATVQVSAGESTSIVTGDITDLRGRAAFAPALLGPVERIISRTVLGSAASSISSGTLPTVPNGWLLRVLFRAQHASGTQNLRGRFNNDSSLIYNHDDMAVVTASGAPNTATNQDSFRLEGVTNTANQWTVGELKVPDYLGASHKTFIGHTGRNGVMMTTSGIWRSTAAITSVSVFPSSGNLVAGSELVVLATPLA
jgi:hypothetical protein